MLLSAVYVFSVNFIEGPNNTSQTMRCYTTILMLLSVVFPILAEFISFQAYCNVSRHHLSIHDLNNNLG